jgi:DNA-binding response OmpR family regulator
LEEREGAAVGHVLVVDDDVDVRAFLCASIERAGWRAEGAESGLQGLVMAASRAYDALVVDQVLPGLAGLDMLRMLSNSDIHVAAVFITGHGADVFREAAMALGVVECLDKPIRSPTLVRAVARAMARPRSWPAGATLFRDLDGLPGPHIERLVRTLASLPTTATRTDVLRHLARAAVDPELSLPEFIAVSRAIRRTVAAADEPLSPDLLLALGNLRANAAPVAPAPPPLAAFLDLLGGDMSACRLSLSECAKRLGIQLGELDHACASLGLTAIDCRHAYQTRRIVRSLVETRDEHVKQITYQLGYAHPSNLTRVFREFFALSPREFRRLLSAPADL